MPKINYITVPKRKRKPFNPLATLLRGYWRASGLTSAQIGEKLGVTADHVRAQIGRPADHWTIGQLKKYCDVLGCPREEAFQAAAK